MRNCMSVKFRRRVCQILRANTGNPRMCGSACRITSATLTCKWLAGQFQLKMLKKQFGSVGAPTWSELATVCNDLFDTVTEKAPLEEANRALLNHLAIFAFIATADAGPDQVIAIIAKEVSPVLCLLFFSVNCHEHQAYLIAKDNLQMMQTVCDTLCSEAEFETVLYFSYLAAINNTWRFSLRAIFMKWTELRGPASSMLHASKQPPKCLSGR